MAIVTPALGIAGILLIATGLAYGLIGLRIPRLQTFLSSFQLAALSVVVLVVYLTHPPISAAIQGAYLVAAVMTGLITGGVAVIFSEMTESLGCLLGGYCFAMWLLVLKPGGLIEERWGRIVLIGGFCAVIFGMAFYQVTKPGAMIFSLAFAGGTAVVLGIDCFTGAGLKEFWLYIWSLNEDLFPHGTTTYPHTRGIKVELAGIVVLTILGVIAQIQLWKIIKDRNSRKESAKRQEEAERDAHDLDMGHRAEEQCGAERKGWEAGYGVPTKESPIRIIVCEDTEKLNAPAEVDAEDSSVSVQNSEQSAEVDPVEKSEETSCPGPATETEKEGEALDPAQHMNERWHRGNLTEHHYPEGKRRVAEPLLPLPPNPADEASHRTNPVSSATSMRNDEFRTDNITPKAKQSETPPADSSNASVDCPVTVHESESSTADQHTSCNCGDDTIPMKTELLDKTQTPNTPPGQPVELGLLPRSRPSLELKVPETEMEPLKLDGVSASPHEPGTPETVFVTAPPENEANSGGNGEVQKGLVPPEPGITEGAVDTAGQPPLDTADSDVCQETSTSNAEVSVALLPETAGGQCPLADSSKPAPPSPGVANPQVSLLSPASTPAPTPTPAPTRTPTPAPTSTPTHSVPPVPSPTPHPRPTSYPTLLDEREQIIRNRTSLTILPPNPTTHHGSSPMRSPRRASAPYTPLSYTYTPPLEEEDMPLSHRRQLLRRQFTSPSPTPTSTQLELPALQPDLQSVRLRNWRESLKADQHLETMEMMADRGRARMIEEKRRELKRVPGRPQSGFIEQDMNPLERVHRSGMNKAHREAMRKMQGMANQRL